MTTTEPTNPLLDFDTLDIISNDAYMGGPMHDVYTVMRREAPVLRARGIEPGFPEWFWAISRHADVVTVSRQFQTFSSAKKGSLMQENRPDLDIARLMIDTDPPDHTRLRTQVNRGFTPRAMRMMEDHYRDVARTIVAEAVEQGDVEFVTKVSAELPLIAIAEMLGVPVEDRHKVFDWSNRLVGSQDPDYGGGEDDNSNAMVELYTYFHELAAEKRKTPRNDIITILLGLDPEGNELPSDRLTDQEFDLFMLLLTVAGNETTRNGISHGLLALIDHPGEWARLKADPALVDSAVEEMLRWGTPVMNFRRTATGDVELHGVQIKEGEPVVMLYASANRDEDVFADPFTFDITRSPNPHLTFGGGGPHFCLGANLARMEMRILFQEIARQVGTIQQTGPITRLRSSFVHGIKSLPVRLTPA
jgi:cholest-4-en-3-one 26-monooxygenase